MDLLPYILESLSQKPKLCDTYENLCEEIKNVLSSENLKIHYGNFQKNIEYALVVGQSLGVLTLTNNLVRMPFKKTTTKEAALTPTDKSKNTFPPNMIPHIRSRRMISRGRRRRSGSRRRSSGTRRRSRSRRR